MSNLSFQNTEVAFAHKSDAQLKKASLLFKSFNYNWLIKNGDKLANLAISLGFKSVIKNTIFEQFCGGEDIAECEKAIQTLSQSHIGTILDYSVEGEEVESNFKFTHAELLKTISKAAGNDAIPFSVFKVTGIIAFHTLEKASEALSANPALTVAEITLDLPTEELKASWKLGVERFHSLAKSAAEHQVRLFIDAEESWIQPAIDRLAEEAMKEFNANRAIVFNTVQLYRHDRLAYLKHQIESTEHHLGFKLVRGAYMEKERARATEMGYQDPIQPNKEATDKDYNQAVTVCIENINKVEVCIGTHNEDSSLLGVSLMNKFSLEKGDKRIHFSQLLGMSDHISYNLAHAGYSVCKYVPYGPVKAVIPYLTRRAQENSGMAGQMGRELQLIQTELKRRNQ